MVAISNIELKKTYYFVIGNGSICKGIAEKTFSTEGKDKDADPALSYIAEFSDSEMIDQRGAKITCFGTLSAKGEDIFEDLDTLYHEIHIRHIRALKAYSDEIKTVDDLIRFPFEHPFCGPNIDHAACEAYLFRANDLLGGLRSEHLKVK